MLSINKKNLRNRRNPLEIQQKVVSMSKIFLRVQDAESSKPTAVYPHIHGLIDNEVGRNAKCRGSPVRSEIAGNAFRWGRVRSVDARPARSKTESAIDFPGTPRANPRWLGLLEPRSAEIRGAVTWTLRWN